MSNAEKASTAYLSREYWPNNSSNNVWRPKAIIRAKLRQVFGLTSGAPSVSA